MLYDQLVQPGEYLCHHGVKGQKWGVRKAVERVGNRIRSSYNKNWKNASTKQKIKTVGKGVAIAAAVAAGTTFVAAKVAPNSLLGSIPRATIGAGIRYLESVGIVGVRGHYGPMTPISTRPPVGVRLTR